MIARGRPRAGHPGRPAVRAGRRARRSQRSPHADDRRRDDRRRRSASGSRLASYFDAPVAVYLALLLVLRLRHGGARAGERVADPDDHRARAISMRTNRISSSLQELAAITGPALAGLALTLVAAERRLRRWSR